MNQYRLRKVTKEDLQLLFDWANDSLVRMNSYHTEPIEFSTHEKWFAAKLADENCCMYILTDGDEKTCYGQVRGDLDAGKIEIDYSIGKEYRGHGLAKKMLALFEKELPNGSILYAEVKKENPASAKVFESLGYVKEEKESIFVYTKQV